VSRFAHSRRLVGGCAVVAVSVAVAVAVLAGGAPASARAAAGLPCASYPRPGTTIAGATPADLSAEYGVLARPRRSVDRLAARWLRSLPESGIVVSGIRFLSRTAYGRLYIVPARHLLAFALVPERCLRHTERALERSLVGQLRREYAHRALCLVIVYRTQESPSCAAAPGTFAPLLYAPGTPGFGMAPDGVTWVRVHYLGSPTRRVRVRGNLWIINDELSIVSPCGLDWLDAGGTVLRTVQSCVRDTT
jgi:hypothetical protein